MVVEWKVVVNRRKSIEHHLKIISRWRGREKAKCLQAFAGILIHEGAKTRLDQEKQGQQMVTHLPREWNIHNAARGVNCSWGKLINMLELWSNIRGV